MPASLCDMAARQPWPRRRRAAALFGHGMLLALGLAFVSICRQSSSERPLTFLSQIIRDVRQKRGGEQPWSATGTTTASKVAATSNEATDPTIAEFATPERQKVLSEVSRLWTKVVEEKVRRTYPQIDEDPFFTTDLPGLLRRYLLANELSPSKAIDALQETAQWRKEWDVLSYYAPGAASELFSEESNPGAEMYFADSLHFDKEGRPYVSGRLRFANAENMHPWRHLRAGVLVFELMATKVARLGRGPASYILDVGPVGNQAGTVSGTAGLDISYDEGKNPYYKAGAGTSDAPSPAMVEEFGSLDNGFLVLKAAIRILNKHYPGVMHRVYYLNSDMLFWGAFKVFSRWIADRGSIEFNFLGPAAWREEPIEKLLESFAAEELPVEWGGSGTSLDSDAFLQRALHFYEAEAAANSTRVAKR